MREQAVLNRECYLVYYRHTGALKKIKKVSEISIYYISEKSKYITIYFDKADEKAVRQILAKIKGIRSFERSLLDRPEINISLEQPLSKKA